MKTLLFLLIILNHNLVSSVMVHFSKLSLDNVFSNNLLLNFNESTLFLVDVKNK